MFVMPGSPGRTESSEVGENPTLSRNGDAVHESS